LYLSSLRISYVITNESSLPFRMYFFILESEI
jgi:hypothetical protein